MNPVDFVRSVLRSKPTIAVFDCDGTLWSNNSGEDFFYWSMEQRMVRPEIMSRAKRRYEDYRAGKVDEHTMCGEMTTMYAGLPVSALEVAAENFFRSVVKPNYFLEMLKLTNSLAEQGCELWAISSTNEWVIREGIREFGIPQTKVLAATAKCESGIVSEVLSRMPSGEGKATAIREVIQRPVDAVFGNSIHDAAMLNLAAQPYAINPNPDLEVIALQRGWTIYRPTPVKVSMVQLPKPG